MFQPGRLRAKFRAFYRQLGTQAIVLLLYRFALNFRVFQADFEVFQLIFKRLDLGVQFFRRVRLRGDRPRRSGPGLRRPGPLRLLRPGRDALLRDRRHLEDQAHRQHDDRNEVEIVVCF